MNWQLASNLPAHIPTDWIILVIFALIATFEAARAGSGRISAFAIALPMAVLLSEAASKATIVGNILAQLPSIFRLAPFIVLFICSYLLVRRMMAYGSGGGISLQSIVSGIAVTIAAVVLWMQVPELQTVWHFGGQIQNLFSESYRFWWLIGAYTALAFTNS